MSSGRRITVMIAATIAILVFVRFAEFTDFEEEQAAIRSAEAAADEPDTTSEQAPIDNAQLPATLSLVNVDGSPTTLYVNDTTDVVVMATWCSYSEGLKNLLNDPRAKEYQAHRRLVFVFERSEWGTMKERVQSRIASGAIKPEAVGFALDGVKENARHSMHIDPSFFHNLPGIALYWDDAHPVTYGGTPQLLTGPGPHFEKDATSLLRRMGMPRELSKLLMDEYYAHASDPKPAGA